MTAVVVVYPVLLVVDARVETGNWKFVAVDEERCLLSFLAVEYVGLEQLSLSFEVEWELLQHLRELVVRDHFGGHLAAEPVDVLAQQAFARLHVVRR